MKIDVIGPAAVIREPGVLITDSGSAMDVLATVRYETGCSAMILRQEQLDTKAHQEKFNQMFDYLLAAGR